VYINQRSQEETAREKQNGHIGTLQKRLTLLEETLIRAREETKAVKEKNENLQEQQSKSQKEIGTIRNQSHQQGGTILRTTEGEQTTKEENRLLRARIQKHRRIIIKFKDRTTEKILTLNSQLQQAKTRARTLQQEQELQAEDERGQRQRQTDTFQEKIIQLEENILEEKEVTQSAQKENEHLRDQLTEDRRKTVRLKQTKEGEVSTLKRQVQQYKTRIAKLQQQQKDQRLQEGIEREQQTLYADTLQKKLTLLEKDLVKAREGTEAVKDKNEILQEQQSKSQEEFSTIRNQLHQQGETILRKTEGEQTTKEENRHLRDIIQKNRQIITKFKDRTEKKIFTLNSQLQQAKTRQQEQKLQEENERGQRQRQTNEFQEKIIQLEENLLGEKEVTQAAHKKTENLGVTLQEDRQKILRLQQEWQKQQQSLATQLQRQLDKNQRLLFQQEVQNSQRLQEETASEEQNRHISTLQNKLILLEAALVREKEVTQAAKKERERLSLKQHMETLEKQNGILAERLKATQLLKAQLQQVQEMQDQDATLEEADQTDDNHSQSPLWHMLVDPFVGSVVELNDENSPAHSERPREELQEVSLLSTSRFLDEEENDVGENFDHNHKDLILENRRLHSTIRAWRSKARPQEIIQENEALLRERGILEKLLNQLRDEKDHLRNEKVDAALGYVTRLEHKQKSLEQKQGHLNGLLMEKQRSMQEAEQKGKIFLEEKEETLNRIRTLEAHLDMYRINRDAEIKVAVEEKETLSLEVKTLNRRLETEREERAALLKNLKSAYAPPTRKKKKLNQHAQENTQRLLIFNTEFDNGILRRDNSKMEEENKLLKKALQEKITRITTMKKDSEQERVALQEEITIVTKRAKKRKKKIARLEKQQKVESERHLLESAEEEEDVVPMQPRLLQKQRLEMTQEMQRLRLENAELLQALTSDPSEAQLQILKLSNEKIRLKALIREQQRTLETLSCQHLRKKKGCHKAKKALKEERETTEARLLKAQGQVRKDLTNQIAGLEKGKFILEERNSELEIQHSKLDLTHKRKIAQSQERIGRLTKLNQSLTAQKMESERNRLKLTNKIESIEKQIEANPACDLRTREDGREGDMEEQNDQERQRNDREKTREMDNDLMKHWGSFVSSFAPSSPTTLPRKKEK